MKIGIISPYPPLKGGISKETEIIYSILKNIYSIRIFSFKNLYPNFLYPDDSQYDTSYDKDDFTNVDFLRKRLMSYKPTKSKTSVMKKEQNKVTKPSEKETDKDTESSVNITNIYNNIKDSVINKSDLSNKKK